MFLLHVWGGIKSKKLHLFLLSYHLILLQATLRHGLVPLLLESDDDQSYEYVDKEEGKHHKVDHIEDGRLHAEAWAGTLILVGGIHRVLQDPKKRQLMNWQHLCLYKTERKCETLNKGPQLKINHGCCSYMAWAVTIWLKGKYLNWWITTFTGVLVIHGIFYSMAVGGNQLTSNVPVTSNSTRGENSKKQRESES